MHNTKWAPILPPSSELARRAWESINAIADEILEQRYVHADNLLHGHAVYEDAVLLAYMARRGDGVNWRIACLDRLNRAIEQSVSTISHFALFGGMCGLGWTVEHLSHFLSDASEQAQPDDPEDVENNTLWGDPCEDLDEALIRRLQSGHAVAGYDLLYGHVGLGVYFLERWPRGRSIDGLRLVVDALERLAERDRQDIAWYSHPEWPIDKACPTGCYNFGVAHGIPGVLHFLCQVARLDVETQRVTCSAPR